MARWRSGGCSWGEGVDPVCPCQTTRTMAAALNRGSHPPKRCEPSQLMRHVRAWFGGLLGGSGRGPTRGLNVEHPLLVLDTQKDGIAVRFPVGAQSCGAAGSFVSPETMKTRSVILHLLTSCVARSSDIHFCRSNCSTVLGEIAIRTPSFDLFLNVRVTHYVLSLMCFSVVFKLENI